MEEEAERMTEEEDEDKRKKWKKKRNGRNGKEEKYKGPCRTSIFFSFSSYLVRMIASFRVALALSKQIKVHVGLSFSFSSSYRVGMIAGFRVALALSKEIQVHIGLVSSISFLLIFSNSIIVLNEGMYN